MNKMNAVETRAFEILLVEDNPGDIRLAEEALREGGLPHNLSAVRDGVDAMSFLRRLGVYEGAPRPDLILLDLNLPKKDGREVLAEIKADRRLKLIPVIVLTSSAADEDILRCYDLGANCYVTKPVELDELMHVVQAIKSFWLNVARLPARERGAA